MLGCLSPHCDVALVASPNPRRLVRTPAAAPADNRTEEIRDIHLADLGQARVFVDSFDRPNIRYTIVDKIDPRAQ